jgi:hypothetical protein
MATLLGARETEVFVDKELESVNISGIFSK